MSAAENTVHAVCHPDFLRLEEELCRRIEDLRRPGGIPRVLVFTATSRQQDRLRQTLAARFPGLVGVDVLTHYTYVRRLTDAYGIREVSSVVQEALLGHLLEGAEDNSLSRYLREFPSAVSRVVTLFTELREALVTPQVFHRCAERDQEKTLAALYEQYAQALSGLKGLEQPYLDRAARTQMAAAFAPQQSPATAVFQYGAHELLAMNLQLLRAIPCEQPVLWLAPVHETAKGWEYARGNLRAADRVSYLEDETLRPFVAAALSFCDWEADPRPLPENSVRLLNAQGPESETETVARQILADLHDGGLKAEEIAVITRSLDPYAPSLEAVFRRHRIPVDSSLQTPLSREPQVQAFTTLLNVLEGDLERQAVIDLARSPALHRARRRGTTPNEEAAWTPDWWEQWSRMARLVRGAASWMEIVDAIKERADANPESLARTAESARTLEAFVKALEQDRRAWSGIESSVEAVSLLHRLRTFWIEGPAPELEAVINQLEDLDVVTRTLWSKGHALNSGELLKQLQQLFRSPEVRWSDPGGVPVLDVMQARGLVFKKVYWMGFNADWLPKRGAEDAFLGDPLRRRLRQATGEHLSLHGDTTQEERLLFAQTAASALEHLQISWQRADAEGRSMAPSLYLEQVNRVTGPEERVPTHPKALAEWQRDNTGLLSPEEGALLSAWGSGARRPEALESFLQAVGAEHVSPHVRYASLIDDAEGKDLGYDSLIGRSGTWAEAFSPSALEQLGRCPHQYFFNRVLGIRPLNEEAKDSGVDTLDVGLLVHKVLELAFPRLVAGEEPAAVLEEIFDDVFRAVRARMAARYPLGWEAFRTMWLRELGLFAETDLRRLRRGEWKYVQGEMHLERDITLADLDPEFLPPTVSFRLRGQVDRLAENPNGDRLVSDYKTGGRIEDWVEAKNYLRGHKLQLSLYALLAEPEHGRVTVELLGLGPGFQPDRGYVNTGPVTLPQQYKRKAAEETLALLVHIAREGRFPFSPGRHCGWCDFASACRKDHVPTQHRVKNAEPFRTYYLSQSKHSRQLTLADVREKLES